MDKILVGENFELIIYTFIAGSGKQLNSPQPINHIVALFSMFSTNK